MIASGALAAQRPAGGLAALENGLVAALFALTVALPVAEILMRAFLRTGIEGVSALVQHVTLALGMLGAALAARDQRLLTLALAGFIKGRAAAAAQFAARTVAAGVTVLLLLAAVDFVAAERRSAGTLVYGIPVWVGELPLIAGYALIAWRLFLQSSGTLAGRALAACLIGGMLLCPSCPPCRQ